ncbi:hypothetical protein BU24DRAFT_36791 [Aaosphaeria arxii CBS 175.79]|uniref:Uncharacterized protein n=1 Tax=Aaosphaeria arxii CBS 175.79 TaxID=1450172 RepID=A0A6A5YAL6_9PLEO|nr:uncharacterized protein BU24DRAFT_36791 [Aaosphaeria arxii CBS 175.79]KAF2022067.1 hypothetical protein BU24DRAFT_36791 [Aaosphaeria arxii CBS 175.79]
MKFVLSCLPLSRSNFRLACTVQSISARYQLHQKKCMLEIVLTGFLPTSSWFLLARTFMPHPTTPVIPSTLNLDNLYEAEAHHQATRTLDNCTHQPTHLPRLFPTSPSKKECLKRNLKSRGTTNWQLAVSQPRPQLNLTPTPFLRVRSRSSLFSREAAEVCE